MKDPALVAAVLADWKTAPVRAELRATLGFLEKLTLTPTAVTAADVRPLREAGLSDQAIADAIQVCAVFSTITRVADALGFEIPPAEDFAASAGGLLRRGYR